MHDTAASTLSSTAVPAAAHRARAGDPSGPRCALCSGESEVRFRGPPAVLACRRCGLQALAVIPSRPEREARYQETYHLPGTGERFPAPFERALGWLKGSRMRAILRRVRGPGSILDVGCGRGDLLERFQRRGWRAVGTQLSRTAAEAARTCRGVDVRLGELPELSIGEERFDAITFFHVLEHVDRPEAYLRRARDLIADGGLLVVEVPNCGGIGFRWLRTRHLCFDWPHHLIFFTPESLRALLERCGFVVEGASRFSMEYSPFTTLQDLLNALPGEPNRLYRALLRNPEGARLRRQPLTWIHGALAAALAVPALAISLSSLVLPGGNTMRLYCRPAPTSGRPARERFGGG